MNPNTTIKNGHSSGAVTIINTDQLKCLNTLISKLGIDKQSKADMVSGFSSGRETSSAKLTHSEAIEMIKHLKQLDPDEAGAEKTRKKIIAMAHEMGWVTPNALKGAKLRADMKHIDDWCVKFGYLHKKLNQHLYKELPALVGQFESVYNSYIRSL